MSTINWYTPSFGEAFASFYHENTYHPPIALNAQPDPADLLEAENKEVAERIQKLFETPEIVSALAHSPTRQQTLQEGWEDTFKKHGFRNLGNSDDFSTEFCEHSTSLTYCLFHKHLPKSEIQIFIKEDEVLPFCQNNKVPFFRQLQNGMVLASPNYTSPVAYLAMNKRIERTAQEAGIAVALPKLQLLAFTNPEAVKQQYCLITTLPDSLSFDDAIATIRNMPPEGQRQLAKEISTIVKRVGIAHASLGTTIGLTTSGQLLFYDIEPVGIPTKKSSACQHLFGVKTPSVEKCGRTGLLMLRECAKKYGLTPFEEQIELEYQTIATNKLSTRKIVLSVISCGLLPLIYAIIALVEVIKAYLQKNEFKRLVLEFNKEFKKHVEEKYPGQWDTYRLNDKVWEDFVAMNPILYNQVASAIPYSSYQDLSIKGTLV